MISLSLSSPPVLYVSSPRCDMAVTTCSAELYNFHLNILYKTSPTTQLRHRLSKMFHTLNTCLGSFIARQVLKCYSFTIVVQRWADIT